MNRPVLQKRRIGTVRGGSDYIPEKKPMQVEIGLVNGNTLKGKAWVVTGKSLADTLGAAQAFL